MFIGIIVISGAIGIWKTSGSGKLPTNSTESKTTQNVPPPLPVFNKKMHSLDDPNSIWVVVNKLRPLKPTSYIPSDLISPNIALRLSAVSAEMQVRKITAEALAAMFSAAKSQDINLMLASGYRSYATQAAIYSTEVRNYGQATADKESARPGYSEHQTGLAADIESASRLCEIQTCFANLPEGKWLADHAYEFGFIVRYPSGAESIVGYKYEPWHMRYVGKDLAAEIHKTHQTLEEFFSLPAAPSY